MTTTIPWPGTPELRRTRARQRALRLWLHRRRRWLAAAVLGLAVLSALRAVAPPPPATAAVWVAARDLPVGQVIDDDALRSAAWPPDAVPGGALDPARAAGRTLAAALRAGEPLTDARLLGPGLLTGRPAGLVATTVRLADPASAALVRPGDRIDLLSAASAVVAAGVLVLAVPGVEEGGGGLLGGGGGDPTDAGALVVGVTPEGARRLAVSTAPDQLGTSRGLTLTVRPPPDHVSDVREP